MEKIPFGVSSRAAILIGRENIANTKGAIIELVKNCYDADSSLCLIFIDNKYSVVKSYLSEEDIDILLAKGVNKKYFEDLYLKESDKYILKNIKDPLPTEENYSQKKEDYQYLQKSFNLYQESLKKLASLYIIDAGEGMTKDIVKDKWMIIGTNNKLINYKSNKSRIKSGAKGIGRFALDKLGGDCIMLSVPDGKIHSADVGVSWKVDWKDFEKPDKIINEINAEIDILEQPTLISNLEKRLPDFDVRFYLEKIKETEKQKIVAGLITEKDSKFQNINKILDHGTCFKITSLHDIWNSNNVEQLFNDLEILVPPRDIEDFSIFLYSSLEPFNYGEILTSISDDFDYKLVVKVDEEQNVDLTIYREEFDIEIIPDEFFELEEVRSSEFANKSEFFKKVFSKQYTLANFIPGLENPEILSKIGAFNFIFYFMKKAPSTNERTQYFYKNFEASIRKSWLDKFSGIKIYRDNFRVRPYGEVKDPAFDWLGLGRRKASSPGAASRQGGYRVQADQVSGIINISRLSNFEFNDKSSREGLQETETFRVFRNIILNMISKFEDDRSFIMAQFKHFDDIKYGESRDLEKAKKLAESILQKEKEKNKNRDNKSTDKKDTSEEQFSPEEYERIRLENIVLAQYAKSKEEEVEKLSDEQKLLRGLASSGILSASLGHHLSKIRDNLFERHHTLIDMLSSQVTYDDFISTPDFLNPFIYLEEMKEDDKKIVEWLGFSLGFTRKDKRKRKLFILDQYFNQLKSNWKNTLYDRSINLIIKCPEDIRLRAFELDFDSMFINLLTNSIDAFSLPSDNFAAREIHIDCIKEGGSIVIIYRDNGPGLSPDISDPNIIFEPLFTTKKDYSSGDDTGTGLGMWIIKSVIDEYEGKLNILNSPNNGFGIKINIPNRFYQDQNEGVL
ncbi:HAMP domain-containing histidine kinase [Acinetobacter bereziniae]|uniref:sensor histidine kinase n=1 Tax=Acinetobacter bereziniae TaxID=106648 RepID=UPI0021CD8A0E|nr:HAMP domain-containing sensor histidine kinase [Acinetobacter bereziniae]MCU4538482.1 HAMP domain-containing histidine kinase [Acinetobacter bereziniae]